MAEFKLHFYSVPSDPHDSGARFIPFSITVECEDALDAYIIGQRTQVPGWEFQHEEEIRNG